MSRFKLPPNYADEFEPDLGEPPDALNFGTGAGRGFAIEETVDQMNDETFGVGEVSDWELEHEVLVEAERSHPFDKSEITGAVERNKTGSAANAVNGYDADTQLRVEQSVSKIFDDSSDDEDDNGEVINLEDEEVSAINGHRPVRSLSNTSGSLHPQARADLVDPAVIAANVVTRNDPPTADLRFLAAQLSALSASAGHPQPRPQPQPQPQLQLLPQAQSQREPAAAPASNAVNFIPFNEFLRKLQPNQAHAEQIEPRASQPNQRLRPQVNPAMFSQPGFVPQNPPVNSNVNQFRPPPGLPNGAPMHMEQQQFPMPPAGMHFGFQPPYAMPPGWGRPPGPQFGGPPPNWAPMPPYMMRQQAPMPLPRMAPPNGAPRLTLLRRPDTTSRKPFDPYAGLMTQRARDWVIKVQLSQLNSFNNYADDYFFIQWRMRKLVAATPGSRLILPIAMVQELQDSNIIPREQNSVFDGALGKVTKSSVHNPRRVIEIDVQPPASTVLKESWLPSVCETLTAARMEVTESGELRRLRRLLLEIEQLLELVLEIEDTEYKLHGLPMDRQAQVLNERQERIANLVARLAVLTKHGLLAVRKGRTLLSRASRLMNADQVQRLLALLPESAHESVAMSPDIAKFVDSLLTELHARCDELAA